jgi:hypothetical protein
MKGADFAWYIHQIRPDLTATFEQGSAEPVMKRRAAALFIGQLADMFVNAESVPGFEWSSPVLGAMLRLSPWASLKEAQEFYERAVKGALWPTDPREPDVDTRLDRIHWIEISTRRTWRSCLHHCGLTEASDVSKAPPGHKSKEVNALMALRMRDDAERIEDVADLGINESLKTFTHLPNKKSGKATRKAGAE